MDYLKGKKPDPSNYVTASQFDLTEEEASAEEEMPLGMAAYIKSSSELPENSQPEKTPDKIVPVFSELSFSPGLNTQETMDYRGEIEGAESVAESDSIL